MPRQGMRGATLAPPDRSPDVLAGIAADIDNNQTYGQILASAGAYRDPGRGLMHRLPFGQPFRRGGKWIQNEKAYPVAMSALEAREKTKASGERHDYFEPGTICKKCVEVTGDGVMSGWVLGGRKFQMEHAHITDFDPTQYSEVEIAPPDDGGMADDAPMALEA